MASVSSLGIGSGLDLSGLVDNLLAAERAPVENSLARKQNRLTSELSGVGIFRGAVSSFQSSLADLDDPSKYSTRLQNNENPEALTASVTNDAAVASYDIDITNLAENHSLASGSFSSLDEEVGSGTIQITFGTITGPGLTSFTANPETTIQTLTLDSSNNTLSGLRDYINEGEFGLRASIINDGSGYRLSLQSENTGASRAMEIIVTDTGDGNDTDALGLSRLAFNATATQMTETQAAEDATLTVNGIAVTSSSNTLNDMVEGLSLTLQEETAGTSFTLDISENTFAISDAIRSTVESYNAMITTLSELGQAGPEGTQAGILVGDSVLRSFISNVRSQMTGTVDGLTGSITALSTIGISTQVDGTLSIDDAKFSSAVADNPMDAMALFAPVGQSNDGQIELNTFTENTVAGSYAVNITQIASQSSLTGATGLSLPITIDNDNDNLSLIIDGASTGSISLAQGSYTTGTDLAAELQLKINSALQSSEANVTVTYDTDNNGFVITSDQYGSSSLVEVTAVDTNTSAQLGFSVGAATAGTDVAGTIGGFAASGSGQTLTASSGDAAGLSINVTGGTLGARDSLRFSRGLIGSMNDLLSSYLDNDGILSAKEDRLNDSLEDIEDERAALELRLEALETRLISQFSALDALVANFQSTGNFLSQQIDNLPGFDNPNNSN